jgi:hypothetical protein
VYHHVNEIIETLEKLDHLFDYLPIFFVVSCVLQVTVCLIIIQQRMHYIYFLRPIILFANIDVSRHILVIDTSIFAKSNMGRREY